MLTLIACNPNAASAEQFNELMKRPDIDQAVARYQQMYIAIRDRLSAAFPGMSWSQTLAPSSAACESEFSAVDANQPQNDAVTATLGNWNSNIGIPDADWVTASAAVETVTRRYGFGAPKVLANRPGAHGAQFDDQYQAVLTFDVGRVAGLSFVTGCHLTADAKKRGA